MLRTNIVRIIISVFLCLGNNLNAHFSYEDIEHDILAALLTRANNRNTAETLLAQTADRQVEADSNKKKLLPNDLLLIAYSLLKQANKATSTQEHNLPATPASDNTVAKQAYQATLTDLNILVGPNGSPEMSLLNLLGKNAKTTFGKITMASLLANPPDNSEISRARGELIKKMHQDPELASEIEQILTTVKNSEEAFLQHQYKRDKKAAESYGSWLQENIDEKLRTYPILLDATNIFAHVVPYLLPAQAIRSYYKAADENERKEAGMTIIAHGIWLIGGELYNYGTPIGGTHISIFEDQSNKHKTVYGFAQLLNAAQKINALMDKYPEMRNALQEAPHIAQLCKQVSSNTTEFGDLLRLLKSDTFKGEYSYFSRVGNIVAANAMLREKKYLDEFNTVLQEFGTLDSLYAVHSFINTCNAESQTKQNQSTSSERLVDGPLPFCQVEFQDQTTTPVFILDNFWNPRLLHNQEQKPTAIVLNSLNLDEQEPKIAIVTGANTSGKSTITTGAFLNVLWGKWFGVAPAARATMSSFNVVSSLNIQDDIAKGKSLFKAEVDRAKLIADLVAENEKSNTKTLILVDELFKGTNEASGTKLGKEFLEHLKEKCKKCKVLYSTHFKPIVDLENKDPKNFKNYKVDVSLSPTGKIIYSYKLTQGINTKNIIDQLIEENLGTYLKTRTTKNDTPPAAA